MKKDFDFHIERNLSVGTHELTKVCKRLENCPALKKIFGKNLKGFLSSVEVAVSKRPWIIWVDDSSGRIMINQNYLKDCNKKILYLDLIHELVHVKQFRDGKELFSEEYKYVDRPTEIEAYKITVGEARRIGMSKKEIEDYLKVDWIDENDHKKLVAAVM